MTPSSEPLDETQATPLIETLEQIAAHELDSDMDRIRDAIYEAARQLRAAEQQIAELRRERDEAMEAVGRISTYTAQFPIGDKDGGPLEVVDNAIVGIEKRYEALQREAFEQCAKVCDELGKDYRPGPDAPLSTASHHTCLEAAKRIRALRDIP